MHTHIHTHLTHPKEDKVTQQTLMINGTDLVNIYSDGLLLLCVLDPGKEWKSLTLLDWKHIPKKQKSVKSPFKTFSWNGKRVITSQRSLRTVNPELPSKSGCISGLFTIFHSTALLPLPNTQSQMLEPIRRHWKFWKNRFLSCPPLFSQIVYSVRHTYTQHP